MKKMSLFYFLVLISTVCSGQNRNNIWYFGFGAGVDFNYGSPIPIDNGKINTLEGCATISDAKGNLLFYTDGISIWTKLHEKMPNGYNLSGDYSSCQSALIIPFIGDTSKYYVFTISRIHDEASSLRFSIVDMSLNNSLGDVTIKNVCLCSPVTETLTATWHSNNRYIWVVTYFNDNSNKFVSFLVTDSGICKTPQFSAVGPINPIVFSTCGYLKFSTDGKRIAYANTYKDLIELFDFNNLTGTFSNYLCLQLNNNTQWPYGVEFSPNTKFLYCSVGPPTGKSKIFQFDLSLNSDKDINKSMKIVSQAKNFEFGALQLGPDGKIYIANYKTNFLSSINEPNFPAKKCKFSERSIYLNGKFCGIGLPNFLCKKTFDRSDFTTHPNDN